LANCVELIQEEPAAVAVAVHQTTAPQHRSRWMPDEDVQEDVGVAMERDSEMELEADIDYLPVSRWWRGKYVELCSDASLKVHRRRWHRSALA